ncbi:hypothetical protein [Paraflavitalea sp. CAU 1676]|uniref:hypothetical protein n=1 Tax=Paraflavitalea sp. CAU 1676 TaxID=3032598 RepID=UPI0023DC34CF|nr:hypothetical protein [Paraflavitalea sp. CAU 1676]MDF2190552.1 hypothetical protein [Paraflavitalea sp. CAU 1676]
MQQKAREIWVGIAPEDFKQFGTTLKKVEATNIFPILFAEDDFKQIAENTFVKGNDQVIKVFYQESKWQFQNLRNTEDRGSLIQFIANRWSNEKIQLCNSPSILFLASTVANEYYTSHIKTLKQDHKTHLHLNPPAPKQKRIR